MTTHGGQAAVTADGPGPVVSHADVPQCPALAKQPKVVLSHGSTPLEPLPRLGSHLGIDLWVKRDDCTGLALGGNKVRQLEYYFGQAATRGADAALVTGALQSNFVRSTAAAARRVGWHPTVQLESRVQRNDTFYKSSGNVLLNQLLGATVHHIDCGDNEAVADQRLDEIASDMRGQGYNPYVIHLAASHPPVGALGYVEAAFETVEQLRSMRVAIDDVVIPSGSGLTHAGFLVGARLAGWNVPVHGICVRRSACLQAERIGQRCAQLCALLDVPNPLNAGDVSVTDDVLAPGYGQINTAVRDAIHMAAQHEALLLDPVYSGRCMAGLAGLVRGGQISAGRSVLFIHTGGTPGIFAYQEDLV